MMPAVHSESSRNIGSFSLLMVLQREAKTGTDAISTKLQQNFWPTKRKIHYRFVQLCQCTQK